MKKKIAICFLLTFCFVLPGCSESGAKQEEIITEQADFRIGVEADQAPYYSVDENGNASGIYVDLMDEISKKGGYTYEFTEIDPSVFQAGTKKNSCDVFLGTMENDTGDMTELFQTTSFYQSGVCLVTRTEDNIKKFKNLRNIVIAAVTSGGEAAFAQYLAVKYEADALLFVDGITAFEDFINGNSRTAVLDANVCQAKMEENMPIRLWKTSEKYYNFHRFTAKGHTEFLDTLENQISEIMSDGTMDTLLQKNGL